MGNGTAILSRGEKPYAENITTSERVALGATDKDNSSILEPSAIAKGTRRYLHLLIQQSPNKPIWQLDDEKVEWKAAGLSLPEGEKIALAFTSLPKAVSFMQAAVMNGTIRDINKVAKFSKSTAAGWDFSILLNPTLETLQKDYPFPLTFIEIDPATAETPDE